MVTPPRGRNRKLGTEKDGTKQDFFPYTWQLPIVYQSRATPPHDSAAFHTCCLSRSEVKMSAELRPPLTTCYCPTHVRVRLTLERRFHHRACGAKGEGKAAEHFVTKLQNGNHLSFNSHCTTQVQKPCSYVCSHGTSNVHAATCIGPNSTRILRMRGLPGNHGRTFVPKKMMVSSASATQDVQKSDADQRVPLPTGKFSRAARVVQCVRN